MTQQEGGSAVERGWNWDPTLYAGSATYYSAGRIPYPPQLVAALVDALDLDGTGQLLDVGCGPGSLTLLLAPHVNRAIGIDADPDMLAEAQRLADEQHLTNTAWLCLRAEDLPADLPLVKLVVFAQSFHWMDRRKVAAAVSDLLVPGGAVVHVHATTHRGIDEDSAGDSGGTRGTDALARPRPPWPAIGDLIRGYLGPQPRAGQTALPTGTGGGEDGIYRGAGFTGPDRLSVAGYEAKRTAEQVFAAVHSLSGAAPHLFGDRLDEFDTDLRRLLATAGRHGRFLERMPRIQIDIWRRRN